ncbi:MAG TPA: YXWGXW repeat-containing protein [Kofleriaceae bacterium]|nr:YXWGXW repeat-containing protein [Kofleriaceae bacterium]
MLRNIIMGSSFALLVSAGAANADRPHEVGHGPVVREHVTVREPAVRERVVVREPARPIVRDRVVVREPVRPVVRGAIYMPRPVIRERYYDFHRRPELIVENFGFRPGFVWVRGHWDWNGGEWIWMPGYFQPI